LRQELGATVAYGPDVKRRSAFAAVLSLANEGVGLGSVIPKIPKDYVTKTVAIGKQIGDGKITVKPTVDF
jgi:hypothetical protein